MSIITGSPGNAKIIKELYKKNRITILDIKKIILFTNFCNPLFIYSFVKNKFILVLLSHYLSNFIIGIFIRNKYLNTYEINSKTNDNENFIDIFFNSINSAISTLLFILGTIITFYILISIFNLKIISPLIEISQGMNYIHNLNINIKLKTILYGGILSFGGLCIHMQIYGILNEFKIKYIPYLSCRIFQSFLTMLLILLFY